jgi:hypothetical protein
MAKTKQRHRPNQDGALVEASRQANWIDKGQTGAAYRKDGIVVGEERAKEPRRHRDMCSKPERPGYQLVGALGVEAKKQWLEE